MTKKEKTLNKAWEQQLINFGISDEETFGTGLSVGYDARDNETCEWIRRNKNILITNCEEVPMTNLDLAKDKYCPYCGRKVIVK